MRIALVGYGRMGHVVETLALRAGDTIVARIDKGQKIDKTTEGFAHAEVAIEFTAPDQAVGNIRACIASGVPVVSGTTGWYDALPDIQKLVTGTPRAALFYAPNFSIGVNILLRAAELLADYRARFSQYTVAIEETHHTAKLDAPSGTAIALAQPFLANNSSYTRWALTPTDARDALPITAHRVDSVPGIHTVTLDSPQDTLTLTHSAKNREGFAAGALAAARFLIGKQGVFTMRDLL